MRTPLAIAAAAAIAATLGTGAVAAAQHDSNSTGNTVTHHQAIPRPTLVEGTVTVTPDTADTLNDRPAGTAFVLAPGLYRIHIVPKDRQTFTCQPGAILDGADTLPAAFSGNANDVTITGCEIRNYHSPDQNGAVNPRNGNEHFGRVPHEGQGHRWTIENARVHHNNGAGVFLGPGGTLRNSRVDHNGHLGVTAAGAPGVTIEGTQVDNNGHRYANDYGMTHWSSGGMKLKALTDSTITGNRVTDNNGTGIWCDIDCDRVTIDRNTITRSSTSGIFWEISGQAIITRNTIDGCGSAHHRGWAWEAGVQVSTSRGTPNSPTRITGNTITGCANGISLISQPRGASPHTGRPWRLAHTIVEGNTTDGRAGIAAGDTPERRGWTDPDVAQRIDWRHNDTGDTFGLPETEATPRAYVKAQAAARGWTGPEWEALDGLITRESAWQPNADNPTSSAYGLFQFMSFTARNYGIDHPDTTGQPATLEAQTEAGLDYIANRYRTPSRALRHWLARKPIGGKDVGHWY